MKIEKITPFLVDRFLLVRIYTDEGLSATAKPDYGRIRKRCMKPYLN